MKSTVERKLLTKSELAPQYTVSKRTIDNWTKDGTIPFIKIGIRYRQGRVRVYADSESAARRSAAPILPPQDGYLFLDRAKFPASFAADVEPDRVAFTADSQVPGGMKARNGAISEPAWKTKPSQT
jgi:excisionase family DNA binding protein